VVGLVILDPPYARTYTDPMDDTPTTPDELADIVGLPPTIDDDYVREKIAEAYADGEFAPLDMAAVKAEFHKRHANDSP
jgi:hypothetical protein